uniref:Reverse transcriptase Ty1/copia-type domain-containing protein n=1 Tax=Solanum lycopersicum TaxID=4081 RepID=A0A3Q7HKW0_SOLLC
MIIPLHDNVLPLSVYVSETSLPSSLCDNDSSLAPLPPVHHMVTRTQTGSLKTKILFSFPVVKPTTIILLLFFIMTRDWNITQLDISIVFLYRHLDELHAKFFVRDLGTLSYFLGIAATLNNDILFLSECKYVEDLLNLQRWGTLVPHLYSTKRHLFCEQSIPIHEFSPGCSLDSCETSRTEAEYPALALATSEIIWVEFLLREIEDS